MRHLIRWTCIALVGLGGVAAAANQTSHKTHSNEASAERGADSLVSGSEQVVLDWALKAPAEQAAARKRSG